MKNNKPLRLARTKKPAAFFHPGVMRSFGVCSFLEDSRYASQAFCGTQPCFRVPGAAQRECNEWCAADTDLGFTRDRRIKLAEVG